MLLQAVHRKDNAGTAAPDAAGRARESGSVRGADRAGAGPAVRAARVGVRASHEPERPGTARPAGSVGRGEIPTGANIATAELVAISEIPAGP